MTSDLSHKYKYKFSFVIPVYNAEEYLAETVDSIIKQTIGFEENCEVIFVNDGSTDNVEEVCLSFKDKYPNNIKYIKQKNSGPGVARNRGLEEIEGRYVSFLDSDDILTVGTLEKVYEFFEAHYEEVDFVSIPIHFFEARAGEHQLNHKFESTRVINIESTPDMLQLSGASTFIRADIFNKGWRFNNRIKRYGEDANFLTRLVLEKRAYGVVAEARYLYRKRFSKSSILDGERLDKTWYLKDLNIAFGSLAEYARTRLGYVPEYVQRIVMYELQWRLTQDKQTILDEEEEKKYISSLSKLLQEIDVEVILDQKNLTFEFKILALDLKFGESVVRSANRRGLDYYYKDHRIYSYSTKRSKMFVQLQAVNQDGLRMDGQFRGILFDNVELGIVINGKFISAKKNKRPNDEVKFLGRVIFDKNPFSIQLPINVGDSLYPAVKTADGEILRVGLEFGYLSKIANLSSSYRVFGKYIVQNINNSELRIRSRTQLNTVKRELSFYRSLLIQRKRNASYLLLAKYILIRILRHIIFVFKNRKIWIVSDRADSAGDNGEAFFNYLASNPPAGVDVYFSLSKKSASYIKLKKIGKVVDRYSFRYKILFLLSDKVISSMADDYVINAFGDDREIMYDLYNFDFIFLQHGITKDDISKWLGKFSKDIRIFIAAARPEYNDLLTKKYGYSGDEVKLTGFPRHDLLNDYSNNKIILAPTWRKNLVDEIDSRRLKRNRNEGFKSSEYFNFYQNLIRDPRINQALEDRGYIGEFYLHPSLHEQVKDFEPTDRFKIVSPPYNYTTAFNEGSLLITDYSSVAFDFAYLRKPVIYTQFDKSEFYAGHLYRQGYFSYENDGFGPVLDNYEDSVRCIVEAINGDCMLGANYRKRIDNFFSFDDKNNSRRVLRSIIDADKEPRSSWKKDN